MMAKPKKIRLDLTTDELYVVHAALQIASFASGKLNSLSSKCNNPIRKMLDRAWKAIERNRGE